VLSERDQQVLLEAERQLRREDDGLVRAFEAFARCGEVDEDLDPRDILDPRDVRELSSKSAEAYAARDYSAHDYADSESRSARFLYRACRAFFMVAFVALLAVFFWVFRDGDAVLRLLSVLVVLPVIGLLGVAMIVLDLEQRR
jgi:hypothetical protein